MNGGTSTDGGSDRKPKLHLASWWDRFLAWLIDVLLVGAVISAFGDAVGLFSLTVADLSMSVSVLGTNGLGYWVYWTALEGYGGQSLGKMVLGIAVTDRRGGEIGYVTAAIESFGKAFLLPLDCLIGWFARSGEYVRAFNVLSKTIVIEQDDAGRPDDVEYVTPDD